MKSWMWAFIKKTLAPLWVGKWTGPTRLSVLNLRDGFRWLMDFAKLLCFPHILGSRFRKIILLVKTGSRIKSKIISTIVFGQNYLGSNFLHRHSTEFGILPLFYSILKKCISLVANSTRKSNERFPKKNTVYAWQKYKLSSV